MSVKRQATSELNHENWDQEDPPEQDEQGPFKIASKDVLEKRVIRTAKRRSGASGDEPKKSVFSAFGGFNKAAPSSFDFLANLTNGNKAVNNPSTSKNDSAALPNLFGAKPDTNTGGIFNTPMSLPSTTKSPFVGSSQALFGVITTSNVMTTSSFTTSKPDSTVVNSPFKIQATASSPNANTSTLIANKSMNSNSNIVSPQGDSSTNTNNKSLFSSTSPKMSSFKAQTITNTTISQTAIDSNVLEKKCEEKQDDKKLTYYTKLKGLNESVSDWIKKHVEETPLCILTPIFKDYEKYLKEIQDEYNKEEEIKSKDNNAESSSSIIPTSSNNQSGLIFSSNTINSKPSIFAGQNNGPALEKTSGFSFGIKTPASTSSTVSTGTTTSSSFLFGITTITQSTSSPFALTTTANSSGTTPFSFGIGKPFSFSPNVQQNVMPTNDNKEEEEEEPPKVEFTPVLEENSIYDKRCKIFVKKDGNFADKGVGTLYIKKIEESSKHQLLVRANTNLGTILLNLILTSSIPTQRLGKNNVMIVCIPTPECKPPPTPILIRVKTSEEADELLETLNKYKT